MEIASSNILTIPTEQHTPAVDPYEDPHHAIAAFSGMFDRFIAFVATNERAIGLAANQVLQGDERLMHRFFAIKNPKGGVNIYINPVIDEFIGYPTMRKEMCLTWPQNSLLAKRHDKIVASWWNHQGAQRERLELTGLQAQIFQHEVDHLNGVEWDLKPGNFILSKDANPRPNEKCPCDSGKKFKKCCGAIN